MLSLYYVRHCVLPCSILQDDPGGKEWTTPISIYSSRTEGKNKYQHENGKYTVADCSLLVSLSLSLSRPWCVNLSGLSIYWLYTVDELLAFAFSTSFLSVCRSFSQSLRLWWKKKKKTWTIDDDQLEARGVKKDAIDADYTRQWHTHTLVHVGTPSECSLDHRQSYSRYRP